MSIKHKYLKKTQKQPIEQDMLIPPSVLIRFTVKLQVKQYAHLLGFYVFLLLYVNFS